MTDRHPEERDALPRPGSAGGDDAGVRRSGRRLGAAERWGVFALAFIVVVTAAWWALALWPTGAATPEWLSRARAICFNTTETGLPDASGWLLLVGQPLGMLGVLLVAWTEPVIGGLRTVSRSRSGKSALAAIVLLLVTGVFAAGARVLNASRASAARLAVADLPPESYPRLDRAAPAFQLVDQDGESVTGRTLAEGRAFVTFAFGNCETICPLVVRNALDARERLADGRRFRVAVFTLDPWRDTPQRLSHIAEHWELQPGDRVVGGEVEAVNAALDAWDVPRERDPRTGDIAHPALVYLLDDEGRIAFAARGDVETLVALAERL